jgi:hypothetical protein
VRPGRDVLSQYRRGADELPVEEDLGAGHICLDPQVGDARSRFGRRRDLLGGRSVTHRFNSGAGRPL